MKLWSVVVSSLLGVCAHPHPADARATQCNDLAGLRLDHGVILVATPILAGKTITLPGPGIKPTAPIGFCRVLAELHSVPGSKIRAEFWLPDPAVWNGKFVGLGNGGFGGSIPSANLYPPLRQGYAAGATDMGHVGNPLQAKWAFRHPVRLLDWAYRANHITAEAGKQLVSVYYGSPTKRSYFEGCSDGGREALMEARRFPADYDGIIAGAPAADFTGVMAQFVWDTHVIVGAGFTVSQLKLIHDAVLARCDAQDGVKDGLLESPSSCHFDPAVLLCKAGQQYCLTSAQVDAARAIYQGPRTSQGTQISNGFAVGGEDTLGWGLWITGTSVPIIAEYTSHLRDISGFSGQSILGTEFYRWMVFGDKAWTRDRFDLDRDWALGRDRLSSLIDSDNPGDLRAFVSRGGKLIIYHGWSDAALPPGNTIEYFEGSQRQLGSQLADGVRLFMVPGMAHCALGAGPNVFDALGAMNLWVGDGAPPDRLIATKYDNDEAATLGLPAKVLRTRPLCAWPKVAQWNHKGSTDDSGNFVCVQPR